MTRYEHRLQDGRLLAWQEIGSGPPLVLLHGWSLSSAGFAGLAGLLNDYRVLALDLPGHGSSSPCPSASLESLADDVAHWLAATAPDPVALGGWSLGGMVALEVAAQNGILVEKLLLIATTPRFTAAVDWPHGQPAVQVKALRRNLARRFEATLGEFFARSFAEGEVDTARMRDIRAMCVRPGGLPDHDTAVALLDVLSVQDQRGKLSEVSCPALVLHGSGDRVTPAGAGRALVDLLPDGRLIEFAGAGHAPHWTRPAEVVEAIREFCPWDR
jgi:pimeloyl-[acyl-carrier protein] methyl ester esterase